MTSPCALSKTQSWFQAAIPQPTLKNFSTQLGVHFEEVAEMMAALTPIDQGTHVVLLDAIVAVTKLADHLKRSYTPVVILDEKRTEYLDAICDQIVTATGCAHMSALDVVGGMREVNRANFSKFDDNGQPIFDENRKVIKGPNYVKADLTPFV